LAAAKNANQPNANADAKNNAPEPSDIKSDWKGDAQDISVMKPSLVSEHKHFPSMLDNKDDGDSVLHRDEKHMDDVDDNVVVIMKSSNMNPNGLGAVDGVNTPPLQVASPPNELNVPGGDNGFRSNLPPQTPSMSQASGMIQASKVKVSVIEPSVNSQALNAGVIDGLAPLPAGNMGDLIQALRRGTLFTKYGRKGSPHQKFVCCSDDYIFWADNKKECYQDRLSASKERYPVSV